MKSFFLSVVGLLRITGFLLLQQCSNVEEEISSPLNGQWIGLSAENPETLRNTWIGFRKSVPLNTVPGSVPIRVAADTKYWLWVNDRLIIREGGLKWGPGPDACYEDEIDLAPHLEAGNNEIQLLLWHFGKNGMSHWNSERAGIRILARYQGLQTDGSWQMARHPAFIQETEPPHPNWRLPESNIRFDARNAVAFQQADAPLFGLPDEDWQTATVLPGMDSLLSQSRPIPFWKDFGLTPYPDAPDFPLKSRGDTIVLELPYNAQVSPWFDVESPEGLEVDIRTDNYKGGSEYNVRTEYITRQGRQAFETPGWMNGHRVRYFFPKGITVHRLGFRETGYATEFSGSFRSDDAFYNELWEKARRTLYITMRDNYMDCPDRERAQWWGDVVLEMQESFYALDRRSDLLSRKAVLELMHWQRSDSTIFSPIPAGNWDKELPTQMLASVGYYGIWMYYWHTGDLATLQEVYPRVQGYLDIWNTDKDGLVLPRKGGWTWGDWGPHKDMPLIFNAWYYMALKGLRNMAGVLGDTAQAAEAQAGMERLAEAFNRTYWTGSEYRSPDHKGPTDDRSQGLAVVAGIAPAEYYPAIREVLLKEAHGSPYMEKYVLEALFEMDYPEDALRRMKARFGEMVNHWTTTLWEGWEVGSGTWGGGTYNHAWSGGGLTLLSSKVAGIEPLEAGYTRVRIRPQPGMLKRVEARVDTPLGLLSVQVQHAEGDLQIEYQAPDGMEVILEKTP